MKKCLPILVFLIAALLSSCKIQPHQNNVEIYYNYDLNEYISVGKYDTTVNRNSYDYSKAAHNFFLEKFGDKLSYQATKGIVEQWDVANINFLGTLNGYDVDGCSDLNYDVTVGSNAMFIEELEDRLVGLEIGKENTFSITMPDDYIDVDARGKEVSFKVVVNFATKYKDVDDAAAKQAGFNSAKDYKKAEDDFAIGCCVFNSIYDSTTFNKYPEKETDALVESYYTAMYYDTQKKGTTIEQTIADSGMTVAEFEDVLIKSIQNSYKNMPRDLVSFYILQKNDNKLNSNDIIVATDELKKKYGADLESAGYSDIEIQRYAAYNKAIKVAREMATVR